MCKSPCWAVLLGCLVATAAAPAATAAGGKIHALVVVDTRTPGVGEKFLAHDRARILDLLENGFPARACEIKLLEGKKATRTAILNHFKQLKVTKDDTVLFYFSGRGMTSRGRHVLQLFGSGEEENLRRGDLRKAMRGLAARLVVIWTDAGGAYDDQGDHKAVLPQAKFVRKEVPAGFRRLFFEARGVVDVTAAEPGTLAVCDSKDGGVFTRTLWKHLDKNMDNKDIDWTTLYRQVKKDAEKRFADWKAEIARKGKRLPAGLEKQEMQTTRAFFLPSSVGLLVARHREGLRIVEVWQETPAKRADLREGETITAMNDKATDSFKEFYKEVDASLGSRHKKLTLKVKDSEGRSRMVQVSLSGR